MFANASPFGPIIIPEVEELRFEMQLTNNGGIEASSKQTE